MRPRPSLQSFLAFLGTSVISLTSLAQENQITAPPALTPPVASADAERSWPVSVVRAFVEEAANETICSTLISEGDVANEAGCAAKIEARSGTIKWASGARPTECGYNCVNPPVMSSTKRLDSPNSRYVAIDGSIKLDVDVPFLPDRSLRIPVSVNFFCSRVAGESISRVTVRSVVGRPVISDPSVLESIVDFALLPLNISRYIESQITSGLSEGSTEVGPTFGRCQSIGVGPNMSGEPSDDIVIWDEPEESLVAHAGAAILQFENVSVRIRSIARRSGADSSSDDQVSFIVFTSVGSVRLPEFGELTIEPGESVDVDVVVKAGPPSHGKLQVLVVDSNDAAAWSQFSKESRYGRGTGRVIQPARKELRPARPPETKPSVVLIRDWEVTYDIVHHRQEMHQ